MMKPLIYILFSLLLALPVHAQRKRDLIDQIDTLNMRLRSTESLLQQSRKNEAALGAKVMEYEKQLESSRATNASLLETLTRITEESKNHTESVGQALAELRRKEGQLRLISDALTSADSVTISLLTQLKQALGQNASIGLENNVLTVSMKDQELFDGETGSQLVGAGKTKLMKLADVLRRAPGSVVEIQNYQGTTADAEDLAAVRAMSLARFMTEEADTPAGRVRAVAAPLENDSISKLTQVRIRPDFEQFYIRVKGEMKQSRGF